MDERVPLMFTKLSRMIRTMLIGQEAEHPTVVALQTMMTRHHVAALRGAHASLIRTARGVAR